MTVTEKRHHRENAIAIKAVGKTKVYDNNTATEPELTATVTGVPANGVAPSYSLSRVEGQNVGGYVISVTAEATANPNYTVTVDTGLFKITPAGNGNTGMISDGGVQIPYVLVPDLTDGDLIYGNPLHYLLGLFGDYEIRIDESVKAVERMHTILGDVAVGGNVVEHQGFVYYAKSLSAG